MLKRWLVWAIVACLHLPIAVLNAPPAWANPVQQVQAQLVSEVQSLQPGTPFWVGLHFKIRQGWHTYWRNPGDSGSAPTLKWILPDGFTAGELVYPYPKRLPAGPLMNFGYEGTVTMLTQVTPPKELAATKPIQLQAKADWLVCQVDCIPEAANLSLKLPVESSPVVDSKWANVFEQTRLALPKTSPWEAKVNASGETLVLRVKTPQLQANQVQQVEFFPDEDGIITNAAPQQTSFDDGLMLKLQRGNRGEFDRMSGVLVLQEQLDRQSVAQAFTIQAPVDWQTATATSPPTSSLPLWQVLLLALAGGMILNLMPCVFPILSLKAFSIVQRTASLKQARIGAIAFTAGVLVSFAVVAGTLLILRGLGQQIGWGFQLQSPVFVTLMAYLMFAVGLSLSGVFVFGASLMGMGQKVTHRSGYWSEFFTGIFATVVATPCTAPFMATAVGVALTQPAPIAVAIFELLGLGLALPYIALSFIPAVQRILPKPGVWMETFAQLLAFPMYAATAWLVWVLTQQTGTTGLAIASAGLLLIAFAAWLHQKTRLSQWGRRLGTIAALAVVGFALTLTQLPSPTPLTQSQGLTWQPYSAETLVSMRQSGKPVFVNFTAAWCITCLVNEQVAFNQPETIAAFQSKKVVLLKADWTNRNPAITKSLASFGRSGVPLYVLYPASNATEPIILPQVLSPASVQNVIENL